MTSPNTEPKPDAPAQARPGDGAAVVVAVLAVAAVIEERRAELTRLDSEIGDGDHGENLARGFAAVVAKLRVTQPTTPGQVLELVATTLISAVGGASGPLLGTAFLRAASALGAAAEVDGPAAASALAAARDGVIARGKAEPGEKTMVDALAPAATAAIDSAGSGGDLAAVLAAAAAAATAGAESTRPLQAHKGRASYLGERSIGHVDPGARSTAYILTSLAHSAAGGSESPGPDVAGAPEQPDGPGRV